MVTPAQGELEYEVMLDAKVNWTDGTAWAGWDYGTYDWSTKY